MIQGLMQLIGVTLPHGSTFAGDIDSLFGLITWVVGFWYVATNIMFFYLVAKYRARDGVKAQYITGSEPHLKSWISVPHALIIFCDLFLIIGAINVWYNVKQAMPERDRIVGIVVQQWAWTFVHPGPDGELDTEDDIKTVDELHVEVDKTYHFRLESKDVLHNFAVPSFRLKQDAIPGRVILGWFKPTNVGEHLIQCAEMCGIGHGIMPARLHVETAEQHDAWVRSHSEGSKVGLTTPSQVSGDPT
jgi:cytochrome c oxidase subunit 2